jgi:polysaccharide biosynthesis/export protein
MSSILFARLALLAICAALSLGAVARDSSAGEPVPQDVPPILQLGPGDAIAVHVYGQPDMDATQYVADDGSIRVALAGAVTVGGLSPTQAAERVETALEKGKYLIDPHVTITVVTSRSQRISVLGQVRSPGRYAIESNTSVFDVLALAGGATEEGGKTVYVLRPGANGTITRFPVDLDALAGAAGSSAAPTLKAGDSLYVPSAEHFYIYGEVAQPNMYRLEPGMTVVQAIARAGGVTPRGSDKRVEIRRRDANGATVMTRVNPADPVNADDVIRVKERLF